MYRGQRTILARGSKPGFPAVAPAGAVPVLAVLPALPYNGSMYPPASAPPGRAKIFTVLGLGLGAISFGSILVRFAGEASPLVIAFYRMVSSLMILAPFCLGGNLRPLLRFDRVRILAGSALALHFAFWISSLSHTSVAVSVLLVNTSPALVAALSALLFAERMNRWGVTGIGLTLGGSVLLVKNDLSRLGDPTGAALALLGALAFGVYLVAGRKIRKTESLLQYVIPVYFIAAVVLGALVLAAGHPLRGFSGRTWLCLFLLGLVPQILGHTSYNWTIRYVPATLISVVVVLEPFLAAAWAWWLLDEPVTLPVAGGGALVASGIALVSSWGFKPGKSRGPGSPAGDRD